MPKDDRSQLLDTLFRGLLAVGLYAAFPAFSDIYRLWRRQAGLVPGELAPQAFEYPPVAALFWEPLTLLPSERWAVIVNGLVMVAAAVGITRLIQKSGGLADVRLWVASPALLILLPMNWDVAVAYLTVVGLVAFGSGRTAGAGVAWGLGLAWKVYPGAILLPAVALTAGWRKRGWLLGTGAGMAFLAYGLYVGLDPDGWRTHLDFAASRTDYQPTLWGALTWVTGMFGWTPEVTTINALSIITMTCALVVLTVWVSRARPSAAEAATLAVTAFLLFNKVFKPGYVLWLIPLLALSRASRRPTRALEGAALGHFAVTFFSLWPPLQLIAGGVRIWALLVLGLGIISRHNLPDRKKPLLVGPPSAS